MKKIFILIISLLTIAFIGCDNDGVTNSSTIAPQIVFVHAAHGYNVGSYSFIENTNIHGVIQSNPIPEFVHFGFNNYFYKDDDYTKIYNGYTAFDSPHIAGCVYDTLNVNIETSLGKLTGTINFPDTIETVSFNKSDTLQINDDFHNCPVKIV